MNIIEYPDREIMAMQVADALASALKECLLVHDFASFAVPGGTTPGPIFDILCGTSLAWDRVKVILTDERWVPEDNSHSNAKLLRQRLLQDHAAAADFVPYYRADQSIADAAQSLSDDVAALRPISLLVLGMGADMHTASLFPGAQGLEAAMANDAPSLCAIQPTTQDMARITLSAPALQGAMETHVIITGHDKRAALERALTLPPEQAPIAAVLGNGTVHWAA